MELIIDTSIYIYTAYLIVSTVLLVITVNSEFNQKANKRSIALVTILFIGLFASEAASNQLGSINNQDRLISPGDTAVARSVFIDTVQR